MTTAGPSAAGPATPLPQNAGAAANVTSPQTKRDLKSWWKSFKLAPKHPEHQEPEPTRSRAGIFGVPLRQSITYANVAISLVDENGQSYIYGYVPIVVAKCGVFLKEKATSVEGIFRLSGSEKRIKELKTVFDSPDRYGKGLVWEGYTVHDAANVLRRYLNDLPEPVVPLDLYEKFRDPLRGATKQAVGDVEGPQFVENFDEKAAIVKYQKLITELPPLNRQLLLYILDLLAVFAAKSDENRMNSQNLAAIFQPGMLSHPTHAMAPEEYRLNQCVIIFLIENQDHFLIGMQGTAADEATKKAVESGAPATATITAAAPAPAEPTTPTESSIVRSSSNASAGAQSVRRDGQVRRNRSVHSRHSAKDDSAPNSPALTATPTTGGLGRSNTVPSKRSPAIAGKYRRQAAGPNDNSSPQQTPVHLEPLTQAHPTEQHRSKLADHHARLLENENLRDVPPSLIPGHHPASDATPSSTGLNSQERLLAVPPEGTPQKERNNLTNLFNRSPTEDSKRQPNKLRKKRAPGTLNPSAHSSNASLPLSGTVPSPSAEIANPMDQPDFEKPSSPLASYHSDTGADQTPRASQSDNNHLHPEHTLKGKKSPPLSLHSSYNEGSDLEQGGDSHTTGSYDAEKEKKRRWRLSRSKNPEIHSAHSSGLISPPSGIRSNEHAEVSTTSFGSASQHKPRKSFTGDSVEASTLFGSDSAQTQSFGQDSGKEKDEPKGPIGWIKSKMREAKENHDHKRNKSPPAEPTRSIMSPGKSLDLKREPIDKEKLVERVPDKKTERPTEDKATIPPMPQPTAQPAPQPSQQPTASVVPQVPAEQPLPPASSAAKPPVTPEGGVKPTVQTPIPDHPTVQHTPPTPVVSAVPASPTATAPAPTPAPAPATQPQVVRSMVDEALNPQSPTGSQAVEQPPAPQSPVEKAPVEHTPLEKSPTEQPVEKVQPAHPETAQPAAVQPQTEPKPSVPQPSEDKEAPTTQPAQEPAHTEPTPQPTSQAGAEPPKPS